jgi:RNA polymerase sigma-70 factor (ECF subfamily)
MLKRITTLRAGSRSSRIADTRNRLYRVALAWCGDPMLADDLVQETLATGISKCHQLRDEQRLFAWLYSILNNTWRGHMRALRPEDELNSMLPDSTPDPCANCEEIELITQVRKVVAELPMIERQVITLVDLGEMSYCEVALVLDIPIGTVMSRLHRARRHLLECMERDSSVTTTRVGKLHLVE